MKTEFLTNNRCYKNHKIIAPLGIMVHSTGCNQKRVEAYTKSWNNPKTTVCVHAFIGLLPDGSVGTVQTLPWNYKANHCGVGASGKSGNNYLISFEICEDNLTEPVYFDAVYSEAVKLCAKLCKEYGFDPLTDIICHSEGYRLGVASNHADVMHWFPKFGKTMDIFREDVKKAMDKKPAGVWSEEARKWATENGLITGYGNGVDGWTDNLTREQMAVILKRFYDLMKG